MKTFRKTVTQYGRTHTLRALTMSEKDYTDAVEALKASETRCTAHTFDSVENAIDRALDVLEGKKAAKTGYYILSMPYTAEEYAKSCKYRMQCTTVNLKIEAGRVTSFSAFRSTTAAPVLQTANHSTACALLNSRINAGAWYAVDAAPEFWEKWGKNSQCHDLIERIATEKGDFVTL